MKKRFLLLTLLLALALTACTPASPEPESVSELSSVPSSQAEELPSESSEPESDPEEPEETPDWVAEGFAKGVAAYRTGELRGEEWEAFLSSQPDFVWLRQYDLWPFGYKEEYYGFDTDWAFLKYFPEEELPDRLTPEELWANSGRLWEFLDHCSAGVPDHLFYGSAKDPAVLDITELWFDGEQLWYRRNPSWSGKLPYQTGEGDFAPLAVTETDTAVELLRENGLVLERFPRYGYERCIPAREEVLALAEGAELVEQEGPEIRETRCAQWDLVRTEDGAVLFTCYPAEDGSVCFLPNGVDPGAILLLRPADPA